MMTLGSLFDGIGGFPLAAVHCGGVPVWASEIEPFPMRVTKLRFPDMIHVGDITKLDGAKLPPVDVICGGSPCQDLSVAGLRKGLAGERSGLFMDQVRIVKEMRAEDERRGVSDDLFDLDTSFGKCPWSIQFRKWRRFPGGHRGDCPYQGQYLSCAST